MIPDPNPILTIEEMLADYNQWGFARQLIKSGGVPEELQQKLAEQYPDFWLSEIAPAAGQTEHDRGLN